MKRLIRYAFGMEIIDVAIFSLADFAHKFQRRVFVALWILDTRDDFYRVLSENGFQFKHIILWFDNGADIESVVNEAVEEVFIKNLDGKNDTLTSSVLLDKAKNTISISKSCKKQIDNMKKAFAESNFKDASKV